MRLTSVLVSGVCGAKRTYTNIAPDDNDADHLDDAGLAARDFEERPDRSAMHELIEHQSDRPQHHGDQAEQRKPSELVVDKIRRQVPGEAGRRRHARAWVSVREAR